MNQVFLVSLLFEKAKDGGGEGAYPIGLTAKDGGGGGGRLSDWFDIMTLWVGAFLGKGTR